METQLKLAMMNDELGQARTSKKEFLDKIESIIPWDTFVEIIEPCYYKGERGNKPYPLELMLRIFLLQNLYDLADMRVMTEVIDSRAFSEFCGVTSPDEVPDGDTIGRFRKKRDPKAHSTKKGNQWHFGYKGHIGVDEESGLVHHVKVTPANTADVTAVPDAGNVYCSNCCQPFPANLKNFPKCVQPKK